MRRILPMIVSIVTIALLFGCQQTPPTGTVQIPGTYPILAPGVIPTAQDIQEETSSTSFQRVALTVADTAVDTLYPADAIAADLIYDAAMNGLDVFDADYAAGKAPGATQLTAITTAINELRALKSKTATSAKSAAIAHANSIAASQPSPAPTSVTH